MRKPHGDKVIGLKRRDDETREEFEARVDRRRAQQREYARRQRERGYHREYYQAHREEFREYQRDYRAGKIGTRHARIPADGACELCGEVPPPRSNGARGLNEDHRHDNNVIRGYVCQRCNVQVAVLDLAFTDPERFEALKAWSLRGAPAMPGPISTKPKRRKRAQEAQLSLVSK